MRIIHILTCGLYNPRSSRKYQLSESETQREIVELRETAKVLKRSDGVKLVLSLLNQSEIDVVTAHGDGLHSAAECFHYHGHKQIAFSSRVIIVALQVVIFGKNHEVKLPLIHLKQIYRGHAHPFWKKNGSDGGPTKLGIFAIFPIY